jgi:nicotinate-nucleotide adenylyltransferase
MEGSKASLSDSFGVFGGTFDPIHYGHLRLAEEARELFNLREVLFVPAAQSPFKNHLTEAEHRFRMVELALADNPAFHASRIEIERGGISYTIDTLRELKRIYPRATLFFLTGLDAIMELPRWHQSEALLNMCTFIVAKRPGFDIDRLYERLPEPYLAHIRLMEMVPIGISATELRGMVAQGRSLRYLTPASVIEYIEREKLYWREDG